MPNPTSKHPSGWLSFAFIATTAALFVFGSRPVSASSYDINPEESIFAIVTHKAGIAAAMAHNHMVHASTYSATVNGDPPEFRDPTFRMEFPVKALVVDDHAKQSQWFPKIKGAGILEEPFPDVSEENRSKIRESMLAQGQLDAKSYPTISAEIMDLKQTENAERPGFDYTGKLAFRVHGKTVTKSLPLRIETNEEQVNVEAIGEYEFTEFDIEPYSAFFGAVKNKDRFHLYANFTATPAKGNAGQEREK